MHNVKFFSAQNTRLIAPPAAPQLYLSPSWEIYYSSLSLSTHANNNESSSYHAYAPTQAKKKIKIV